MLIKCPECGKEVSDTIDRCIHCGYALKEKEIKYDFYIQLSTPYDSVRPIRSPYFAWKQAKLMKFNVIVNGEEVLADMEPLSIIHFQLSSLDSLEFRTTFFEGKKFDSFKKEMYEKGNHSVPYIFKLVWMLNYRKSHLLMINLLMDDNLYKTGFFTNKIIGKKTEEDLFAKIRELKLLKKCNDRVISELENKECVDDFDFDIDKIDIIEVKI